MPLVFPWSYSSAHGGSVATGSNDLWTRFLCGKCLPSYFIASRCQHRQGSQTFSQPTRLPAAQLTLERSATFSTSLADHVLIEPSNTCQQLTVALSYSKSIAPWTLLHIRPQIAGYFPVPSNGFIICLRNLVLSLIQTWTLQLSHVLRRRDDYFVGYFNP